MPDNFRSAKRVKLDSSVNISHIHKWEQYRREMGNSGVVTMDELVDFAESMLGLGTTIYYSFQEVERQPHA